MKSTIRSNVFETNSSSVHTLCLGKGDYTPNYDLFSLESGSLKLGVGEYGWGAEILSSELEKLDYLAVAGYKTELIDFFQKNYPHLDIEFSDSGYIDHQSCGMLSPFFKGESNHIKVIEDIVFDPNSLIYIDNDNDTYYSIYKD